MLTDLRLRLRALFRRADVEQEIDEELRFHVDHQVAAYMAKGYDRSAATRQVRLEFGPVDELKEEYRDALGIRLVDDVLRNVRYVVRGLWRARAFTTVAVLTLALAVAANSAKTRPRYHAGAANIRKFIAENPF